MRGAFTLALGLCVLASACTAGLEIQVQRMRHEIRTLRRQISSQQVRQEGLANRVLVVEERLRGPAPASATAAAPPSAEKPAASAARAAAARPAAAAARPSRAEDDPPPLPVVRLRPPPKRAPAPRPPTVPRLGAKRLYALGLRAFRARRLARALRIFRAFLHRFPDHSLSDNALYWSGRTYVLQNKRREAERAFRRLPRRYPTGNKVPDALVALAGLLDRSGQRPQAQKTLARVVRAFPASEAAKEASRRLREMRR